MRSLVLLPLLIALSVISASGSVQNHKKHKIPKELRISGDALDGLAVRKVRATVPPLARAARLSGSVVVEMILDENGSVMGGRVLPCHPLLKDAAEGAAVLWRFKPTIVSGALVKVIGPIVFNFNWNGPSDNVYAQADEKLEAWASEFDSTLARQDLRGCPPGSFNGKVCPPAVPRR